MDINDLIAKITTDLITDTSLTIQAETELLMSGIIDSLGVVNLVSWLEERASVAIDPGDVVIEHFETPTAIMSFVGSLQSQPAS